MTAHIRQMLESHAQDTRKAAEGISPAASQLKTRMLRYYSSSASSTSAPKAAVAGTVTVLS